MKRISTDAEYLNSGYVAIDADGIPVNLGYQGTGSPEGKVAAPVGSLYTDQAATGGAIRWIKKSGTGATGWAVEYGDTGWRNMNAQVSDYVSGSLYVTRSTDLIHIHFDGLVIAPESNPFWLTLFTLPEGMRPQRTIHARMEMGAGAEPGDRYISMNLNGEFRLNFPQNHSGAMFGYMTFAPRDRTWPATLPGTPT